MSISAKVTDVLDREFLPLRGKLLEVAAALDRIRRAERNSDEDPRMEQIRRGLEVLCRAEESADRAEQFQMALSLPYDPEWRKRFGLA